MTERFGIFDFGLDAAQEARAAKLHADCIIVELMFQGPCGYRSYNEELTDEIRTAVQVDLKLSLSEALALPARAAVAGRLPEYEACWRGSGITAANLQVNSWYANETLFQWHALRQAEFDRFPWLVKALTADDIRAAKRDGRHSGFLNYQVVPTGVDDVQFVDHAHRMGVRMIGLTYNRMNNIGCGCVERVDAGLSIFGSEFIARMNELGVIVDTAHAGPQTTIDACAISTAPVIASHTAAEALQPTLRAKSDDELRAIADTGGVIGIAAIPRFLSDAPDVTIEAMYEHIEYVAGLVGIEHVAIGTDWPMQMPTFMESHMDYFTTAMGSRPADGPRRRSNLIGFDDYRDYPNITRGLVSRGYTDEQVAMILGENALRVFKAVCG